MLPSITRQFAELPSGDRIAVLDDQWALVQSGAKPLASYLGLVAAMGDDLNERAWTQIADALGTIEFDERGTAGHAMFAAYARAALRPVFGKLGWQAKAGETPGVQRLRRTVIGDLGAWGDEAIIAEARRRFAEFVKDRNSIPPDEQAVVLSIVARDADAATFAQLHEIAKSARNETELRRYYTALMQVRDPQLAAAAVKIAFSAEIPPQAESLRLWLVFALSEAHQQLAWNAYVGHLDSLLAPAPTQWPPVHRPVQSGDVLAVGAARQVGTLGQGAPAGGNGAGPGARHGDRPIQGGREGTADPGRRSIRGRSHAAYCLTGGRGGEPAG